MMQERWTAQHLCSDGVAAPVPDPVSLAQGLRGQRARCVRTDQRMPPAEGQECPSVHSLVIQGDSDAHMSLSFAECCETKYDLFGPR